jgi:ariadne-1
MRWNRERLIETYMEEPETLLEAAGLGQTASGPPKFVTIKGFVCDICCDDEEPKTYALKCGHRYCVDCYQQYLSHKIREEGEAARIQCPTSGCSRIVDSKSLEILVTPEVRQRYTDLSLHFGALH